MVAVGLAKMAVVGIVHVLEMEVVVGEMSCGSVVGVVVGIVAITDAVVSVFVMVAGDVVVVVGGRSSPACA